MSNYTIAEYPQSKYSFRLYDNIKKLDVPQIVASNRGCVGAINTAYFSLEAIPAKGIKYFDHQSAVMFAGKWGSKPKWHEYGICVDKDGYITLGTEKEAIYDYAVALPPSVINGKDYNTTAYGRNGVSYTGLKADGTVVNLVAIKDDGLTSAEAVAALRGSGCIHILRWDGSWSSRGFINGKHIKPSQYRCDRTWLLVFERKAGGQKPPGKEEPVENILKVCLDPGHGVETAGKCAPDKSYYEHEFNLDIATRLKALLERHSVAVTLTRSDAHDVTLEQRVKVANGIKGLDLFVSIHSNASGDGSGWTSPDGYGIYTSAAGATANRNIAANKILGRAKASGIKLWGNGLFHEAWYVCKATVAPAILIEHGFHTNKIETAKLKDSAYRQKLAEVGCKGILDYLGIAWVDEPVKEPEKPSEEPWYAGDQKWVVEQGISDGTRPEDSVTRAEVWTMLHRMENEK